MSCVDWFEPIAVPFGWLLMNLYNLVQNYGLALFLVAVIVRVLMLPFQMKGKRGMMRQSRLQPKIAELQKRHAANKQKLNEEMAKLYKEEGVNPASGCLWSFIQMPIMIALFIAIRKPLSLLMGIQESLWQEGGKLYDKLILLNPIPEMEGFYAEINIAHAISENWETFKSLGIEGLQNISFNLGIMDLSRVPEFSFWEFPWGDFSKLMPLLLLFLLPILSGGAQFVSAHIMRKMNPAGSPDTAKGAGAIMKFMPLLSVWFGFMFPAALSFYWTIGTGLQIAQDIWLTKKYTKILDEEDAEKEKVRKVKEAELEAKRIETERLKAEGLAKRNSNTSKRKKQKSEKQDQLEKAAEWEKKNAPEEDKEEKNEPGRIGNRRFARGRAYDPGRYSDGKGIAIEATGEEDDVTGGAEDFEEDFEDNNNNDDYIGYESEEDEDYEDEEDEENNEDD